MRSFLELKNDKGMKDDKILGTGEDVRLVGIVSSSPHLNHNIVNSAEFYIQQY